MINMCHNYKKSKGIIDSLGKKQVSTMKGDHHEWEEDYKNTLDLLNKSLKHTNKYNRITNDIKGYKG